MTDPTAQLYLVTPPVVDAQAFTPALEAALAGGDIACVLVAATASTPEPDLAALVRVVQAYGAAALVPDDPALAIRLGADGVHVTRIEDLAAATRRLKPDGIVGAGNLLTRDDAMTAGESGIDYVMFGTGTGEVEPFATRLDRVAWWAEIFQVPCVALAHHGDEAARLAEAGAEFVALADVVWSDPDGPAAAVARASQAIATGHAAFQARQAGAA